MLRRVGGTHRGARANSVPSSPCESRAWCDSSTREAVARSASSLAARQSRRGRCAFDDVLRSRPTTTVAQLRLNRRASPTRSVWISVPPHMLGTSRKFRAPAEISSHARMAGSRDSVLERIVGDVQRDFSRGPPSPPATPIDSKAAPWTTNGPGAAWWSRLTAKRVKIRWDVRGRRAYRFAARHPLPTPMSVFHPIVPTLENAR